MIYDSFNRFSGYRRCDRTWEFSIFSHYGKDVDSMGTPEERVLTGCIGHALIDGRRIPVTIKTDSYDDLDADNCPHGKPWEDNCEQCNDENEFTEDSDVGEPLGALDDECPHQVLYTEDCAACNQEAAELDASLGKIF